MVSIIKKIRKIGNGFYIPISKTYIDDGLLKSGSEYQIIIKEPHSTSKILQQEEEKKEISKADIQRAIENGDDDFLENLKK